MMTEEHWLMVEVLAAEIAADYLVGRTEVGGWVPKWTDDMRSGWAIHQCNLIGDHPCMQTMGGHLGYLVREIVLG